MDVLFGIADTMGFNISCHVTDIPPPSNDRITINPELTWPGLHVSPNCRIRTHPCILRLLRLAGEMVWGYREERQTLYAWTLTAPGSQRQRRSTYGTGRLC